MTDAAISSQLAYYARHGAALFPIPAGSKVPTGIIASFKHDHSSDPAQWYAWSQQNPGCNFGVVGFASRWIIVDVDTTGDRDEAWALWCELCATWQIPVAMPHVQSANQGWHIYFSVPADMDAAQLRQPDAIKKRINIRCVGYTVAAGSTFEGKPYILLSDAAPYPAPSALIQHCTRTATPSPSLKQTGTRDRGDVAALLTWMNERGAFAAYEDWCAAGMAVKVEFGDDGLDLWRLTHDETVDSDTETTKWQSFASEPTSQSVTLASLLDRAQKMGWRGSVRKSTSAMFDGVAALAAAAGATLPAPTGMPMLAGQEVLTEIGRPVLTEFLASTQDAPARPASSDYPQLPDALSGHGLFNLLRDAVSRIVAMGESKAKMSRTTHAAAILSLVHQDIYAAVCRRLAAIGNPLPERAIKLAASAYADKVERVFVKQDDWIYDAKGQIEQNNSDNVAVFLGIVSAEVRWNAWLERMEIRGFEGQYPDWAYLDDSVVRKLRTRANRTKTRFVPGENFFWDSLFAIAYANTVDPVCDRLDELAGAWDRQPRLSTWLTHTCGVPCDPYHQAVGRNIIGGMVRRIREAGCKHDTMPIFYGPQGTGKSTLAAIIADMGFSSLVDIELGAGQHFTDSVLLGDAAKELVLSLAGKTVAEISEMGMHGSANASHVKAMVSRAIDAGRTAYARSVTERPRRNIFIGTTNDAFPLADPTGNRRFLPVLIAQELDLKWLHENIGQVIGEAAALHTQGHDFAIPREVWAEAGERQEAARQESDIETMLVDWLTPTEHTSDVSFMTCADMVQLASFAGWRGGSTAALRVAVLHRLGFRNDTTKIGGKATKVWVRGNCRPSDIVRRGVRYLPSVDGSGRPQVTIRSFAAGELAPEVPGIPSRSI